MSTQAESLDTLLKELEILLKEYSPMMNTRTEKVVDRAIKYGAVFAEVSSSSWKATNVDRFKLNPVSKALFSLASVTFEVRARF